jgi:hypothetical protein
LTWDLGKFFVKAGRVRRADLELDLELAFGSLTDLTTQRNDRMQVCFQSPNKPRQLQRPQNLPELRNSSRRQLSFEATSLYRSSCPGASGVDIAFS